jgi:hypothetical protein
MRTLLLGACLLGVTNLLAMPNTHCKLVPGVGCGDLVINKSARTQVIADKGSEKRYADEGMTFSFGANDILESISVTGKQYATDKGISPGDKEERVLQVYGKPTKSGKMVLYKGEDEPIGSVGDRSLEYPGILFVIAHGRVWAIIVSAK